MAISVENKANVLSYTETNATTDIYDEFTLDHTSYSPDSVSSDFSPYAKHYTKRNNYFAQEMKQLLKE